MCGVGVGLVLQGDDGQWLVVGGQGVTVFHLGGYTDYMADTLYRQHG